MVYLALSVCCSLAIAAIFKLNETRGWNRVVLLTANYWVATVLAGGVLWAGRTPLPSLGIPGPGFLMLATITGGLFIGTYFILSWATKVAGMGLATGIMRVSVVVPVIVSWIVWQEEPSAAQMAGIMLASAAFFGIASRRGASNNAADSSSTSVHPLAVSGVLLLLFLSGGVVDSCMKVFDEAFAGSVGDTMFLLVVYTIAAAVGSLIAGWNYRRTGARPDTIVLRWGAVLGFCNYGATLFFLRAVARLPAPFVFPANSIAIVIGAALIGVYGWGERLSRANWVGLAAAALALVLLRA